MNTEDLYLTPIIKVIGNRCNLRCGYCFYHNLDQLSEEPPMPNSEVAIRSTLKEDVYVIFAALNEDNSATIKLLVNPLVKWLWIGGFIMGIGTIIAMWPDRREKKLLDAALAQSTST